MSAREEASRQAKIAQLEKQMKVERNNKKRSILAAEIQAEIDAGPTPDLVSMSRRRKRVEPMSDEPWIEIFAPK